jgi:hypothetical protein
MDGVLADFHLEAVRAHLRAGSIKPTQLDHYGTPLELQGNFLRQAWLQDAKGKSLQKWLLPLGRDETNEDWMARFWSPIKRADFVWHNLEPYPWFRAVIDLCQQYADYVEIVTTPNDDPRCLSGKFSWFSRFGISLPMWQNGRKAALSRPGTLLLDDYDKNVMRFSSPQCSTYGADACPGGQFHQCHGDAIMFPAPWNSLHVHSNNPLAYVRTELEKLVHG